MSIMLRQLGPSCRSNVREKWPTGGANRSVVKVVGRFRFWIVKGEALHERGGIGRFGRHYGAIR